MAVYKVELSRDLLSLGVSPVGDVKTCSGVYRMMHFSLPL